jgi:predicted O-linked N-acetylglucosamine transferase (SPINDLY family)
MKMADKQGIIRLTRVAHVRGLRLSRAATDARVAHETAVSAQQKAQDRLDRQEQHVVEARAMFARNPACPQARLWLTHSTELMGRHAEAMMDAEAETETTEATRAEAVRAVARHQARSERIAEHHKSLLRAHRLSAETLAEIDAPPGIPQVAI